MVLSLKEVAEILKLVDASECDEVVVELEGTRLVVRRNSGHAPAPPSTHVAPAPGPAGAAAPADASAQSPAPQSSASAPATDAVPEAGLTDVRAPMVGTFYRKPAPDEPAFVEVGQKVAKGDPLGLIEVMKLYTTIEAPCAGTIEVISAEDATLVEFDQLLVRIRAE